jgi:glucokinase
MLKTASADFGRRRKVESIGISCGGPLDTQRGLLLSPPNLPGWEDVPIKKIFQNQFRIPIFVENDANAGALAEWKFGAGKGVRNMVFLTFGTGMGAGLILDGRLYRGSNDLGGEVGHVRLARNGPLGYHKRGSFEGFCSGAGLAQMMAIELQRLAQEIGNPAVLRQYRAPGQVTGKDVVRWARRGDKLALKIVKKSGMYLGKALALMIDILNPELIVIGSMGFRLGELLLEPARKMIRKEAIPAAHKVCRIVPAQLGERIGDYAALCVAMHGENLISSTSE